MRRADGARIRALREQRGESQESLASRSGTYASTLRLIENGKSARPRELTLRALAAALGVTVEDITRDEPAVSA